MHWANKILFSLLYIHAYYIHTIAILENKYLLLSYRNSPTVKTYLYYIIILPDLNKNRELQFIIQNNDTDGKKIEQKRVPKPYFIMIMLNLPWADWVRPDRQSTIWQTHKHSANNP